MNYIYDVTLNFQKKLYDYYDWNKKDKITNIKIIPFIKTTTKNLKLIIENKIKFNNNFLNIIKNKTETYNDKIKYAFLISDGKKTIAIKINHKLLKSSLPLDEHDEITKIINKTPIQKVKIKIIKKEKINNYKTRFEIENENYIKKELSIIKNNNDKNKLSYICLECFGKSEFNIENALYKIKKEITKRNDNFHKIIKILKITNQK